MFGRRRRGASTPAAVRSQVTRAVENDVPTDANVEETAPTPAAADTVDTPPPAASAPAAAAPDAPPADGSDAARATGELRELVTSLRGSIQELTTALRTNPPASARPPITAGPRVASQPQPQPAPAPPLPVRPGRCADEIAAAMGQLNTLLLGSSPAFAGAMRMQTDAIASGLGALNAISNQQSHHALGMASTARGIAAVHERTPRPAVAPAGTDPGVDPGAGQPLDSPQ